LEFAGMNLIAIIISIMVYLIWFIFSGFSIVYWMTTPRETILKIEDKTKRFLYWYGFSFSIAISAICILSFVIFLALQLHQGF